ncbi:hypothetical protein Q4E93_20530 [Flavitalea sp. BT771]|uniref:hypothetical protein n=1 Tax=Flavitalea sp. BT771 TaxID=3063329 RepID=UPI0026E223C3|nr:hypothetical protein [Flavitalea sp. BT771]MDO6433006.1 hypothetical protein [Flavitalea sp. BT771]MDV6221718.1 hypothetical protein [Flavitalea sp. BT771]
MPGKPTIHRRAFLKGISLTGLTILPGAKVIAGLVAGAHKADTSKFVQHAVRLMQYENLLHLEFYFINVTESEGWISPRKYGSDDPYYDQRESYMVVRLPQQHIAEESFKIDGQHPLASPVYASTTISGYSFLVFRIFFDRLPAKSQGRLRQSVEELMNWNAAHFNLIVRKNIRDYIFQLDGTKAENQYPLGYTKNAAGVNTFDPENIPKEKHLSISWKDRQFGDSSPFTAIEVPWGLVLSPALPDQTHFRFRWNFTSNGLKKMPAGPVKASELWMATLQVERIKQAALTLAKPEVNKNAPNATKENPLVAAEFQNSGDNLMQLLLVGVYYDEPLKGPQALYLPSKDDRKNLVDAYLRFHIKASTRKMAFTPLGISTEMKFRNTHADTDSINLFGWRQSISFGRDQEVKVAHLFVDSCFGLKMLVVSCTKRRTIRGVAILEYYTLLMPLEMEKDYSLYDNNKNIKSYQTDNYKYNTSYKKITFGSLTPKRIQDPKDDRINNVLDGDTVLAFWAKTPQLLDLEWDFIATDWHGKERPFKSKLFLLSQSLADKVSDTPKYPLQFDRNILAMGDDIKSRIAQLSAGTLLDLESIDHAITEYQGAIAASGNFWHKIENASGQFKLGIADQYRDILTALLAQIESGIRAKAWQIEDEIMEEYMIFKKRILDIGAVIWENIGAAQQQALAIIQALQNSLHPLPDPDGIKRSLQGLADDIQTRLRTLADWDALQTAIDDYIKRLSDQINVFLANADAAIRQMVDEMNNVLAAAKSYRVKDYFETEKQRFLRAIPLAVRGSIIKDFDAKGAKIKNALETIRSTEAGFKGRIDLYGKELGYAVYGVEEELEKMKAAIIIKFPDDWQQRYEDFRQEYQKENAKISNLKTDFIIFRNNYRQAEGQILFDFHQDYACFPQMHTAQVYVQTITDIVHKEIPIRMKFAEDYYKNQADDFVLETKHNVARVFAEIKADTKELVKTSMREIAHELGGLVNPELAADFMTYMKDGRDAATNILANAQKEGRQLEDSAKAQLQAAADHYANSEVVNNLKRQFGDLKSLIDEHGNDLRQAQQALILMGKEAKEQIKSNVKEIEIQAQDYFKGLEAKILGSIHLKDILGVGFELPKIDRRTKEISYQFITEKLQPVSLGPFAFYNKSAGKASRLTAFFKKQLTTGGQFYSSTALTDFSVGIFDDRLLVSFEKLEILTNNDVKNKVSVKIADVQFQKELAFLQALSKNIQVPGTGIVLNITPQQISAEYAYTFPAISGGAFTMANLKFRVGVIIPLSIGGSKSTTPIIAMFGINGPDDKFVVAAGIYGGRGHFVIETTPKYLRSIDTGIEFGGYFALDLTIAKGEAFLMAGIRFVYTRDDIGNTTIDLYCTLSCGGSVTVFGFITVSVLFMLILHYQQYQGGSSLYGIASVSYSIKIGFFKKSFTLSYTKRLAGTDSRQSPSDTSLNRPPVRYEAYLVAGRDTDPPLYIEQADYREEAWINKKHGLKKTYAGSRWTKFCRCYKLTCNTNQ